MRINLTLTQAGAGVGAMAIIAGAIYASVVFINPFIQSDSPPFAGVSRVLVLAQNYEQLQKVQKDITDTLERVARKQDQQDMDYWQGQLAVAEARLKVEPTDILATEMKKVAIAQIQMITDRIRASALIQQSTK